MSKPLVFALDFDDTFTACPEIWSRFVRDVESNGHTVLLVTARRDTDENNTSIRAVLKSWGCVLPIIFTSLGSKLHAIERQGLKVDIWIDDEPEKLVHGH